jgi:CheY-like chemotaxis protein
MVGAIEMIGLTKEALQYRAAKHGTGQRVGQGTRVAVWLRARSALDEGPIDGNSSVAVLVVDEDEWVRARTAHALRRAGYGVLEASDATAALNLLGDVAGQWVGIVLTDSGPGVSGSALAETLTDRWPAVRVVLMGSGLPESGIPGDWPSNSLLRKPFSERDLLAAIAG